MNNFSVSFFRDSFINARIWLVLTVFLSGCTSSYLQDDSAKYSEHFNHQNLIGKRFETKLPITVFKLRTSRFLALHDVPLAIVVADKKPGDLLYYYPYPLTTLPPGTVLEMVGEMAWSSSAINAQSAQNFDYFIVHDRADASNLLLPFSSWFTQVGLQGQTPRAHIQVDFPEPFLREVDVPSQWTCVRYDIIDKAQWHSRFNLNISRRVMPPTCESAKE